MMFDSLNIIIPVYNEGENILQTLAGIEEKVLTPHRILIIYDFDGDNTLPVLAGYRSGKRNLELVKNRYGRGVLNALKTSFDAVKEGVLVVVMADFSDDLSIVDDMFRKINQGCDIVCGSRYMPGGRQVGGPLVKKILSRLAGVSLHYFTGIPTRDITNSFKMYRKSVLDAIEIRSSGGFEVGMEIVVKAFLKGYRIAEIPAVWRDRTAGRSRFKLFKWLPKYACWYLYAVAGRVWRAGRYGC